MSLVPRAVTRCPRSIEGNGVVGGLLVAATNLPSNSEVPLGRFHALAKVTQLGHPDEILAFHSALAPTCGNQHHTHTHTLVHPVPCVFFQFIQNFSPEQQQKGKKVIPPEQWKLLQWVCPWKNSSNLRVGKEEVGEGVFRNGGNEIGQVFS